MQQRTSQKGLPISHSIYNIQITTGPNRALQYYTYTTTRNRLWYAAAVVIGVLVVLFPVYYLSALLAHSDAAHMFATHPPPPSLSSDDHTDPDIQPTLVSGDPPIGGAHVFYYPWYGTPENDGRYLHWDHEVLANPYRPASNEKPHRYEPPEEIGADFYPMAGCYSSTNATLIHTHMQWLRSALVGVIVVSWYPAAYSDGQIESNPGFSDKTMKTLLDIAALYGIKVALHVEPYKNRNAVTLAGDIKYCLEKYGAHPAFYRHPELGLAMFYVYDSYLTSPEKWAEVLHKNNRGNDNNIRGTDHDAIVIGLLVERGHMDALQKGGFDGAYTYFATDGFTYGSTIRNWPEIKRWATQHNKMFIPSVGPGYVDTRIRPWNAQNARGREQGAYYDRMMDMAIKQHPDIISITSWNEWHEGTQIEPAVPAQTKTFTYLDYAPNDPMFYLNKTRDWLQQWQGRPT